MRWTIVNTPIPAKPLAPWFASACIFFLFALQSCSAPQPQASSPSHLLDQKPSSVATPPQTPILKLETGGHTEDISRMALDANNKFLVTGSKDKTVRVWDIHKIKNPAASNGVLEEF